MKKILIALTVFFTANSLSAQYAGQVAVGNASGSGVSNAMVSSVIGDMDDQYDRLSKQTGIDDFAGSPYTNDKFVQAPVFYKDEGMGTYYYRYNAYNEEIEIKKTNLPEEKITALTKDKAINVRVQGRPLSFATFIDKKGNTLNGYLTTVLDGETYDLYKRINVKFTEGQKAQNSFVKAVPNRFTHFIEYYYQEKGVNRIDEVPLKTNQVAKLFKEPLKSEVKNYIKDNNLDMKDEADLIKVFEYLDNK
ncbi:MAG: hypothetical protein NXH90_06735 [Flavobacteriaceae bacterium]|nr:hypothetical protein [Flavobacteriaceae bacterium]